MPANSNGRVTMAVLSTKLDTVIEKLDKFSDQQDHDHDRIGVLESEVRRVADRVGVWAGIQTALALLLSSVAAWLGTRR